jgi:hypothetical protein
LSLATERDDLRRFRFLVAPFQSSDSFRLASTQAKGVEWPHKEGPAIAFGGQ